jgi:hypothetical protein
MPSGQDGVTRGDGGELGKGEQAGNAIRIFRLRWSGRACVGALPICLHRIGIVTAISTVGSGAPIGMQWAENAPFRARQIPAFQCCLLQKGSRDETQFPLSKKSVKIA